MDLTSFALLCGLSLTQPGGKPVPPEVAAVRLRMLFLRGGMGRDEALAALRPRGLPHYVGAPPAPTQEYRVGPDRSLRLVFRYGSGVKRLALKTAELSKNQPACSVPPIWGLDPPPLEKLLRELEKIESLRKRKTL